MFAHMGCISPPGILSAPVNTLATAGPIRTGWPEPLGFTKPFPAKAQQWSAFQPEGRINSTFPDGWRSQFDYGPAAFYRLYPMAPSPYPAGQQQFAPNSGNPSIPAWF